MVIAVFQLTRMCATVTLHKDKSMCTHLGGLSVYLCAKAIMRGIQEGHKEYSPYNIPKWPRNKECELMPDIAADNGLCDAKRLPTPRSLLLVNN